MSFFSLVIERELVLCNGRTNRRNVISGFNLDKANSNKSKVSFNVDLSKIVFSKPRLLKNFVGFSNFPFLALSNGGLFFYSSGYINFLNELNFSKSGVLLFDDLYSYKNKIVF
jgi:hypothetical protein